MSVVSVTVLWLDLSAYIRFSVVLWMFWPENQITRQLRALQRAETGFHCLLFFLRHLFFWNDAQSVIGRPCCRSLYSVQDTNVVAALNSFGIQVQFCAEQCKKKTPHSKFANEGYLWADFIKVQFSGAVQLLFLWHFRDLIKEEISSINIFILWVNWTHRKAAALFSSIYFMRKHSPSFSGHHGTSSCCEICLSEEPATVPRVSLTWLWLYIFPPPSHAIFLNFSDNSRPESPTEPPQSLLQRARFKLDPSSWRIVTSETGVLECETINQISMDTGHLRH